MRFFKKIATLALIIPILAAQSVVSKTPRLTEEQRIVHVLNRLGFGPRPGDVERIKSIGLENYINQQLAPERIADTLAESKTQDLSALKMSTAELYEKYPQPGQLIRRMQDRGMLPKELSDAKGDQKNPQENPEYRKLIQEFYKENGLEQPQRIIAQLQASRILRAVYSERQLQEVMVDFWTNHFNIFFGKGADRWLLPAYDRDTIRPHAMGKFSTLLQATAQSPAMLFYLDNFQSVSPNANGGRAQEMMMNAQQRPRRGINENYARELMELHTLGVDGGYTQKDVTEVARCFTGWTIFQPRGGAAAVNALRGEEARTRRPAGSFFFNMRAHDDGEKVVLGNKIPAGGGFNDGLKVLDILARHPSTAKFIATKLVRHFVSDNPPPALVNRVATVFTKSDGDIRETLRAIFFSSEFYSPEAHRAKVKRPFELAVSAIRVLGADTNGGPGTHQWIARMGEPLYGFQTPNGYSDAAESWVNTGGLLERMNFGVALAGNRVQGTKVDLAQVVKQNTDKNRMVDESLRMILAGEVSAATRDSLMKKVDPADPVMKVVGLILGTPEFQRQ
ncbi:MAG TPA: DUF1800 domain-containing protein [Pyrinomonadaceae bacterium]|nr:DUF1800 domain-containing protein [Pyrinomonadaceae bacterium]